MPSIKKKSIEVYLDDNNKLNFTIIKENGKFKKFAINYSAKIDDKWHAVYRSDNYHGFVHEQRLWIGNELIPLPEYESMDLKDVFDIFFQKVKDGHARFRKYFEERKKNGGG
ncbi:hypothetical protein HYY71_04820 [Candidatus Woesearchaeota archaeon]|nr:hypothetical protein [Candidatus Woesearchaeota archaeon]